jgi:hypothetical protein
MSESFRDQCRRAFSFLWCCTAGCLMDPTLFELQDKLNSIQHDVRELKSTVERLIVGHDGNDGLIPRVTRHDEQIGSSRRFLAWLTACFVGLAIYVSLL